MTFIAAPSHTNTNAVRMAFNLLLKPFSLLACAVPVQVKQLGKASPKLTLHVNPDISGSKVSPALAQLNDVRSCIFDLVKSGEWLELAHLLHDWDQSRSAASDGTRFARHALFAVADAVSIGKGIDGMPSVSDATVKQINDVLKANPDCYTLAAISAYLRICQAWNQRDDACQDKCAQAATLLDQYDAEQLNSPLLAGIACDVFSVQPTDEDSAKQGFSTWAQLDPKDRVPYAEYKYFRLAA